MIRGIGLDMVHIPRLESWLKQPALLERFFHPGELSDSRPQGHYYAPSLAARFAAKEAFGKALGQGLRGLILKEIEVKKDALGQPRIEVHGQCAQMVKDMGIRMIYLSLSHEHDTAAAMVVLEE